MVGTNTQAGFDKLSLNGDWLQGWREDSYIYHSLSGARWGSMNSRCNTSSAFQKKQWTYAGCENHFESFNNFVEWSQAEVGYSEKEMMGGKEWFWQLDKDIISRNNKVYSPNTCLFVPQYVNKFVSVRKKKNGLPLGVSVRKSSGKFVSQCINFQGKVQFLGYYDCLKEAHKAWQEAKMEAGYVLADKFKDEHIKLYTSLTNWVNMIQTENQNNLETII